jgi:predicted outer membrane repeat protein
MRKITNFLVLVSILAIVNVARAGTIHVPVDQLTIQAGIDAALVGDTVLVADGTYTGSGNRSILIFEKNIVVISENGPDDCIIDCEGSFANPHNGFNLENCNSVVRGFRIRNGYSNEGGGIYCYESSATIEGNVIIENYAEYGGGIYCEGISFPHIEGNVIAENDANYGAGIFCWTTVPTIRDNSITGNECSPNGAGAGICCSYALPTITGNLIAENVIYVTYPPSHGRGGGIACFDVPVLNVNHAFPKITNNTIAYNFAEHGNGIYCQESSPIITNCILWGTTTDQIVCSDSDPLVTYSDIMGGWPGEGNKDEPPVFEAPWNGNYRLSSGSPCIDAGDPTHAVPLGGGCRIDMGALEFWKGFNCWMDKVPSQWR